MERPAYRIETATAMTRYVTPAGIVLLAVLVLLPFFATRGLVQNLIFVFYMLALAQLWNLLAGYAGLVSVGQQAFVGLGGYMLFALTVYGGLDPLVAIVLAGVIAFLFAFPTALIVFRLRGAYFAIGTWVVAEVYRLVFAQIQPLGGGTGTPALIWVCAWLGWANWTRPGVVSKSWFGKRGASLPPLLRTCDG
jgi:branched-chain amino acid transport system permease protein